MPKMVGWEGAGLRPVDRLWTSTFKRPKPCHEAVAVPYLEFLPWEEQAKDGMHGFGGMASDSLKVDGQVGHRCRLRGNAVALCVLVRMSV
jgi:hypothetical protein